MTSIYFSYLQLSKDTKNINLWSLFLALPAVKNWSQKMNFFMQKLVEIWNFRYTIFIYLKNIQCCSIENHQGLIYVVNWHFSTHLIDVKSATVLFLDVSVNKYGLGLSYKLLFIIIAQKAAKLWPVKVRGQRKILSWAFSNPVSLSKSLDVLYFSLTSSFEKSQFCSPFSYDDKK